MACVLAKSSENRLRVMAIFGSQFKRVEPFHPAFRKKFRLRRRANQWPQFARPAPQGAYRDRHGRWRQDAMDAFTA
jgi:hypothetical protein